MQSHRMSGIRAMGEPVCDLVEMVSKISLRYFSGKLVRPTQTATSHYTSEVQREATRLPLTR
jgi:hypothetical protein